jgi:hypothetical protein
MNCSLFNIYKLCIGCTRRRHKRWMENGLEFDWACLRPALRATICPKQTPPLPVQNRQSAGLNQLAPLISSAQDQNICFPIGLHSVQARRDDTFFISRACRTNSSIEFFFFSFLQQLQLQAIHAIAMVASTSFTYHKVSSNQLTTDMHVDLAVASPVGWSESYPRRASG